MLQLYHCPAHGEGVALPVKPDVQSSFQSDGNDRIAPNGAMCFSQQSGGGYKLWEGGGWGLEIAWEL